MIVLMGTWMTWLQWFFEPPGLCTPMTQPRTVKIPSLLERRPSASLASSTRPLPCFCAIAQLSSGHFGNSFRFKRLLRHRVPFVGRYKPAQPAGRMTLCRAASEEGLHHETDAH